VPYSRFKEVSKKNKELEKELQDLKASSTSEEEAVVEKEPDDNLRQEIRELKMDKYLNQYPELNDKREELDDFLESKSSLPLEDAIDLFRARYGLISTPNRKGLEKVVAGSKTAPTPRWTLEQIDELRMKDERQYLKLMESGAFDETLKKW
jgi:hypothetical protein